MYIYIYIPWISAKLTDFLKLILSLFWLQQGGGEGDFYQNIWVENKEAQDEEEETCISKIAIEKGFSFSII